MTYTSNALIAKYTVPLVKTGIFNSSLLNKILTALQVDIIVNAVKERTFERVYEGFNSLYLA